MSYLKGKVLFITGAGVSKDSGIPTFRGEDGYYLAREPISIEKYRTEPDKVWQEIAERREIIGQAKANRIHNLLVEIEKCKKDDFYLITQNIDNLHRVAGSERLLEIHGNIWQLKEEESTVIDEYLENLQNNKYEYLGYTKLEYLTMLSNHDFCRVITQDQGDHSCPIGYRPNITFLGESLTERVLPLNELLKERIDHIIILGSSLTISTAPMIVIQIKYRYPEVKVLNIDPFAQTEIEGVQYLREDALSFLEREWDKFHS